MNKSIFTFLGSLLIAASVQAQAFDISTGTGPFAVSFRGSINTTYFGWVAGTFDADSVTETAEILTTPIVSIGTSVAGIALNQIGTTPDILAGSNNIYNGAGPNSNAASITFSIPTSGTNGSGFTTIIIQGNGSAGGPGGGTLTNAPLFGSINGISPTYIYGRNANNAGQFWVKYEIPGNQGIYSVQIDLAGGTGVTPTSITDLRADTQWSATSYATDTAAVPEPGTVALLGLGGMVALYGLRRRQRA